MFNISIVHQKEIYTHFNKKICNITKDWKLETFEG